MRYLPILLLILTISLFLSLVALRERGLSVDPPQPLLPVLAPDLTNTPIPDINEDQLWLKINDWKHSQDNYRYEMDADLCSFAETRVDEIQKDWSHSGFKSLPQIKGFYRQGENLSKDYSYPQDVLRAWLESPTHRQNLDENFTHSCIRCKNNFCVQLFGKY